MKLGYRHTIRACFIGYIIQAIVNNFVPLLFVTFQSQYHIPLSQITVLITVNFVVQLSVDLLSVFLIDRMGYRASAFVAHAFIIVGMAALIFLPELFPNAFVGLLISVVIYAVGGGFLEVLLSPLVEACPTEHKSQTMAVLHSFYCWGSVGVICLSTLFFALFGTQSWKILTAVWIVLPLFNFFYFIKVPIASAEEGEKGVSLPQLFRNKMFWLFLLIMFCAGAGELSISQWASVFAEKGLGVSKTVGDLAGPALFALLMAVSLFGYSWFNYQQTASSQPQMAGMKFMMVYMMPIMMLFWFNSYSSGLCYYYLLSNIFTIGQTLVIRRMVDDNKIHAIMQANAAKKSKGKKSKFQQRLEEMQRMQQQQQKRGKK